MGLYKIELKKSAEKDLNKIPQKLIYKILKTVEGLRNNPFPRGVRKITGTEKFFRIRIGDYRIIYHVDEENKIVTIYYIRHRREAYRRF